MDDVRRELAALRRRMRLQHIASVGVLVVLCFAMGGADVVARTFVETDSWIVKTNNLAGSLTTRMTLTTGENHVRLKLASTHLELAQQTATPVSPAAGALWYDSNATANRLKYWNGSVWIDPGAAQVFKARVQRDNATQISLRPYAGDQVEVNGLVLTVPSGGLTRASGESRIDASGLEVAGGLAADTTYYLYASNSAATYSPSSIRASSTAPLLLGGVKYLGTTGNAANWRFVGWVRTNATSQFEDSSTKRFVVNYYNRRSLSLAVTEPASSWTYNTTIWRPWNNNTANRVEFIANGEDAVSLLFSCNASSISWGVTHVNCGIGLDSTTAPSSNTHAGTLVGGAVSTSSHIGSSMTAMYADTPSEGYHYLQLLEVSTAPGAAITFWGSPASWLKPGGAGFVMG